MNDSWLEALEQRVRALPGVRFAESRRNSKMYMAGALRFFVPTFPPDRRVQARIEAEFTTFARRVRKSDEHEFGTRPSDVDRMQPLGPPEIEPRRWAVIVEREPAPDVAPPPITTTTTTEPMEVAMEAVRTVEAEAESHPVERAPATAPVEVPVTEPRKGVVRFQPCPVAGCSGNGSAGRHIAQHKAKGELPKDYSGASRASKRRAAKNGTSSVRADAQRETRGRRAASADREPQPALGADVRHYVDAIYNGLTALSKSAIKDLAEYADTLKTENGLLRRENAKLREAMDRFEKAFAMVKPSEPSVVAKLRR